jgi:hypothetical protein
MQAAPLVPAQSTALLATLQHPRLVIKRPFWSFLGRRFQVYAPDGRMVLFVRHPLLKLREEFTVFTDETERVPVLRIRARQIIGIDIANDVFDAVTGERVGTIKKRGLKSILRDTWDVLDASDQPAGLVQEDGAALLRRFFPILLGKWRIELAGAVVARVRQVFRFFVKEFELDLSEGQGRIDPRFAVACALLALMAEVHRER